MEDNIPGREYGLYIAADENVASKCKITDTLTKMHQAFAD